MIEIYKIINIAVSNKYNLRNFQDFYTNNKKVTC